MVHGAHCAYAYIVVDVADSWLRALVLAVNSCGLCLCFFSFTSFGTACGLLLFRYVRCLTNNLPVCLVAFILQCTRFGS